MSGTIQTSGSVRVLADHVIGFGKGERILEYQGEFFYENGELLKDKDIAEQLPQPFRAQATVFVAKQPAEPKLTPPSGPAPKPAH